MHRCAATTHPTIAMRYQVRLCPHFWGRGAHHPELGNHPIFVAECGHMKSSSRAWIILFLVSVTLLFVGHHLAGREGLLWALTLSLSLNAIVYFYGDHRLQHTFRGRLVEGRDPWGLAEMVGALAKRARIPLPQIIVLDISAPQTFSYGRNLASGTIVVTEGLLESFKPDELRAVVAYQVASISRMDTLIFGMASAICEALLITAHTMDRALRWLIGAKRSGVQSRMITHLVAPIAGVLLRACVRPAQYFAIDAEASRLTDAPHSLAHALWKLHSYSTTRPFSAPASVSHCFIVNPLTENSWTRYFRVQPGVDQRIMRLTGHFPI